MKPGAVQTPVFGRLIGRTWNSVTGELGDGPEVRADVYVFAIQTCRDPGGYELLELDQWEFRVVPARIVLGNPVKTVGMSFLNRYGSPPLHWNELADAIDAAARA